MAAKLTVGVIAGGAGQRMGVDKRLLSVAGVPLLRRVLRTVGPLAAELLVAAPAANPPPAELLAGTKARIVHDRAPGGGPLAGIEAVLAAATYDPVLVVAADQPWLQRAVLRLLVESAGAQPEALVTALASSRGPEPLLAVYRRDALSVVTGLVDAGERRVGRLVELLPLAVVAEADWRVVDPAGRSLVNLNTPQDMPG